MTIENILRAHGIFTSIIPDQSIASAKLANGSITSAKIADGTITNADLATDIKLGSLGSLQTAVKSDVVSAVNELKQNQTSTQNTVDDLGILYWMGGI